MRNIAKAVILSCLTAISVTEVAVAGTSGIGKDVQPVSQASPFDVAITSGMITISTSAVNIKIIDIDGVPRGIKFTADGNARISAKPYLYDVAEGNISGHYPVKIMGFTPDVDNTRVDLWDDSQSSYVFPSSAGIQMQIVSTSSSDTALGTGLRSVELHYLDSAFSEQEEYIVLNGTTPVLSVSTHIARVNWMHSSTTGINYAPLGDIKLQSVGGATLYSKIRAGNNAQLQAIYTVPNGANLYLTSWNTSSGSTSGGHQVKAYLRATSSEDTQYTYGIFQFKSIMSTEDGGFHIPLDTPIKIPGKTDIKISVVSDQYNANAEVTGLINGRYEYD